MIKVSLSQSRFCLILFVLVFVIPPAHGQRKSELIIQIDSLQAQVRNLQTSVAETQARENASLAKAASYETQVTELKEANATLLKNLGNFADVSNKSSEALNQALASLNIREQQLKGILELMGRNDSTIIALLSDAKGTLGENTQLKVTSGSLIISGGLTELFGSDTGTEVTEGGKIWLKRVADLAKANPEMKISVEGLTMIGDINTAANQATSVMNVLQTDFTISPARIKAAGKDGGFSEGVDIRLHPDYQQFYRYVKNEIKN